MQWILLLPACRFRTNKWVLPVENMEAQHRTSFPGFLSVVGAVIFFSCLGCETEGRGVPADSSGTAAQVCKTPQCIAAANEILEFRNASVEPCHNFYDLTCGEWIKMHPAPEDKPSWGPFTDAMAVMNSRLKDILEKGDVSNDLQGIKDARKFYSSCLDVEKHREQNMAILQSQLDIWGGWPLISEDWKEDSFNWKKVLLNTMRTNSKPAILDVTVGTDRRNNSRNAIIFDMADPICYTMSNYDRQTLRKEFVKNVAQIIARMSNRTLSEERLKEDAHQMIEFQRRLCLYFRLAKPRGNEESLYNRKTVAELQNYTDKPTTLRNDSKVDWTNFLNDFFEGTGIQINENQTVVLTDPYFMLRLIYFVDEEPRRAIANYLFWQKFFEMYDSLSPEIRQLRYDYEANNTGTSGRMPRWETCVEATNSHFPNAVGYEYVKLYFDADAKKNVEEIISNVLKSFIKNLKVNTWMDDKTRTLAIEKAANIVQNVGYPDWFENATAVADMDAKYDIGSSHFVNLENIRKLNFIDSAKTLLQENDRTLWNSRITMVDATYYPEKNSIVVPAGLFQPPFYVKGRPEAMNYGAIGGIIAHEISHAFDVSGRYGDKFGNLAQWWSNYTLNTYLAKKECFWNQYGFYPVPELLPKELRTLAVLLDGKSTLSENIADNVGIQEAFRAYQRAISQQGTEPRLPGLEQYSPQQLFYIGHTMAWCESRSGLSLVNQINNDPHSPMKYRVLIPLGNSKDFANAWNCTENNFTMKPNQTCELW